MHNKRGEDYRRINVMVECFLPLSHRSSKFAETVQRELVSVALSTIENGS